MQNDYTPREIGLMFKHIDEKLGEIKTSFAGVEERVKKIEDWKSNLIGKLSIITSLIALAWGYLSSKLF